MTQQLVNIGAAPDDRTGTPIRDSFDIVNDNFNELYAGLINSSTWAARGSGTTLGERKLITDIGPAGGSIMMWRGAYWGFVSPTDIVFDMTLQTSGTLDLNEQIIKQATLPAGILRAGRYVIFRVLFAKSSTGDAMSNARLRLGTTGLVLPDAQIGNTGNLATTGRSISCEVWYAPTSATNIRVMGNQNKYGSSATSQWTASNMAQAHPQDVTIPDIDANALLLSATTQMQATTNSNLGQVAHLFVQIVP